MAKQCQSAVAVVCFLCFWLRLTATRPLVDTVLPLSEIIWRPEGSTEFVGSPSIVRLPNGTYLASHDDFGPGGVSAQGICITHFGIAISMPILLNIQAAVSSCD